MDSVCLSLNRYPTVDIPFLELQASPEEIRREMNKKPAVTALEVGIKGRFDG
jgi:hypothetical protein